MSEQVKNSKGVFAITQTLLYVSGIQQWVHSSQKPKTKPIFKHIHLQIVPLYEQAPARCDRRASKKVRRQVLARKEEKILRAAGNRRIECKKTVQMLNLGSRDPESPKINRAGAIRSMGRTGTAKRANAPFLNRAITSAAATRESALSCLRGEFSWTH